MIFSDHAEFTVGSFPDDSKKIIESFREDVGLEQIRIFSKSGEIVYSSDPNDSGMISKRDYFREIIAKGNVYTNVVRRGTKSLEGRVVPSAVVETYVPIMRNNKFIGAIEIYFDIAVRKGELDKLLAHSITTLLAIALSLLIIFLVILFRASQIAIQREKAEKEREKLIEELQDALAHIKKLSGLLPICSNCKKIRDDKGYWNQIEIYIRDHTEAEFSLTLF